MKKNFIGFFSVLMLSAGIITAQDCNISVSGFILDRATGEPLDFSTIGIIELGEGTIADSNGFFLLSDVCPGHYHIHVDHLGCPPLRIFIAVLRDTSLTIFLEHHSELLREIIVQGKSSSIDESQSRQVIGSSLIKEMAGRPLADITQQMTGVRSIRTGSAISKPVIHGLSGNRVAIINNGLLQAGQQWGVDHAPEIDPNAAEIITVVKGSDAIQYGAQAMGGAILVEAGPINPDPHIHGLIGYGLRSNGFGHHTFVKLFKANQKLDWRVSGALRKEGDHRAPEYFLTNTGSFESSGSLQLIYRTSPRTQHQLFYSLFNTSLGVFAGSHISNLTDLEQAIGRETPFRINDQFSYKIEAPRQQVIHHLLKYSGKRFRNADSYFEWSYGLQSNHRQEFDIRRGGRTDKPALDLQLWSHAGEGKFIYTGDNVRYKAGVQVKWTDNSNDYDTGILPLIPDYREGSGAIYFSSHFLLNKWVIEGGARYDLQQMHVWSISQTLPRMIIEKDHTYHDLAFSAGVFYNTSDQFETRLHNMIVRRSPEVNELYSNGLHQGIAGIEEGDHTLLPESSVKSILTQSIVFPELLHIEATAFSHFIYKYIYLKPQDEIRLTIRGAFPVYTYEQDDSWIRGIDLAVISDISHRLEWSGKISLIKGTIIENKKPLSFIPPTYASTAISWSIKDSKNWKGTKFLIRADFTAQQKQWDAESELLVPPESYFLLSAVLQTSLKLNSKLLRIGLHGENLLNVKYRDYLNRLRYFADEQGIDLRLNLRYEF